MMLTSVDFGCSDEIITIVSMLSVEHSLELLMLVLVVFTLIISYYKEMERMPILDLSIQVVCYTLVQIIIIIFLLLLTVILVSVQLHLHTNFK